MNRILYTILFLVLFIIMIISYEGGNTNMLILDGIALILWQNNLFHIEKYKKEE